MEYPEKIGKLTRLSDSEDWTAGDKGIDIVYQTEGRPRAEDLMQLFALLPIDPDQKHGALIGGMPEIDESITIFRFTETAAMTWSGYGADDADWLFTTLADFDDLAGYIDEYLKGEF